MTVAVRRIYVPFDVREKSLSRCLKWLMSLIMRGSATKTPQHPFKFHFFKSNAYDF